MSADSACPKGTGALTTASAHGHCAIVQALLAGKAHVDKPNRDGSTALFAAAGAGRPEIVSVLVSAGADVNHKITVHPCHSVLTIAAQGGHQKAYNHLVDHGADRWYKVCACKTKPFVTAGGTAPQILAKMSPKQGGQRGSVLTANTVDAAACANECTIG